MKLQSLKKSISFTYFQKTASCLLSMTPVGVVLSSKRRSLILSLKGSILKKLVFPYNDLLAAL